MKDWLADGFDYDAWANRLLANVVHLGPSDFLVLRSPGPYQDFPADLRLRLNCVFTHLLWAERIWVERCGIFVEVPEDDSKAWIDSLHEAWRGAVGSIDPDKRILYSNFAGVANDRSFGEIARHVITHGVYHRGQIREIFGQLGGDSPSTDLIGYYISMD